MNIISMMKQTIRAYASSRMLVIMVVICTFVSRLPLLSHAFLLRGERDIVLTGLSLLKTGKDLYGNVYPIQFFGLDQASPFLSFYFSALGWLTFPSTGIFFARLPFLISACVAILLIFEIILFITKSRKLSVLTAAMFAFNPGYYHLSMLALEINLAFPLLLFGILKYLQGNRISGWIFFILSFFTYNGFRPLLPFLGVYLELYHHLKKPNLRQFSAISLATIFLFAVFFIFTFKFIDGKMMSSRSTDIVFLNYSSISPEVDFKRNTSLAPPFVKNIIHNKITETVGYMLNVLYEGVGLDYLFISGDKAAIYTSTFGGIFFTSFVWFYFLGFLYLGKHFEKRFIYVLGFIPVALTASVVNVSYVSITIRSILATVGFAYIIAAGIVWFIDDILAKIGRASKITLLLAVTIFLIVDVFLFGYSYIFRRPVTMFQSFFENERQLVEYMKSANRDMVIYDPSPKNILTAYQVLHPAARIEDMPALLKDGDAYILGNGFKFIRCPNDTEKSQMFKNGTVIAFGCLSVDEYKKMISERHGQIMYKDFSRNVAYFIYNSLHTK